MIMAKWREDAKVQRFFLSRFRAFLPLRVRTFVPSRYQFSI